MFEKFLNSKEIRVCEQVFGQFPADIINTIDHSIRSASEKNLEYAFYDWKNELMVYIHTQKIEDITKDADELLLSKLAEEPRRFVLPRPQIHRFGFNRVKILSQSNAHTLSVFHAACDFQNPNLAMSEPSEYEVLAFVFHNKPSSYELKWFTESKEFKNGASAGFQAQVKTLREARKKFVSYSCDDSLVPDLGKCALLLVYRTSQPHFVIARSHGYRADEERIITWFSIADGNSQDSKILQEGFTKCGFLNADSARSTVAASRMADLILSLINKRDFSKVFETSYNKF